MLIKLCGLSLSLSQNILSCKFNAFFTLTKHLRTDHNFCSLKYHSKTSSNFIFTFSVSQIENLFLLLILANFFFSLPNKLRTFFFLLKRRTLCFLFGICELLASLILCFGTIIKIRVTWI